VAPPAQPPAPAAHGAILLERLPGRFQQVSRNQQGLIAGQQEMPLIDFVAVELLLGFRALQLEADAVRCGRVRPSD
jgi:hypothetical protein